MQYSLFTDDTTTSVLLVRESDGATRPANRAEILAVARDLASVDELRSDMLNHPERVKEFLRLRLANLEHEVCAMLLLDNQLRLISYLEPFRGTITQAAVYPREIVKLALKCNAAAVILAHNHPSGLAQASAADIELTRHVKQALDLIDVRLVDHCVVAGAEVVSMSQAGLM